MEQMHSLLKRQLRRHFGDQFRIPKEWQGFIDAVNDAYSESDMDRGMFERSLELSSQELIQANSEVQAIFLAIPDLLFRIDHEGKILNYKAGTTTDLLLNPKELLGKRIQDVPVEQVSIKFSEAIKQMQVSKAIINIEYSLSIQNESTFFEARFVPLPEDQIVVIIRNITERKRTESALQESEQRFRALYENAKIGLYRTTPDGKILMANKMLVKMLGYPSFENLADRNLEEGNYEPTYKRKEFLEIIEKDGEINNFESAWVLQDGRIVFVRESAQAIRDSQGTTLYYDGVMEDITDRKQSEEALHKKEEAQQFFSERLTRVLNTINELSKIESYDELCQRSVELAIERLGFDRVGLCFLSEDRHTLCGVYGTDENGHLRNEKHLRLSIKNVPTVQRLVQGQDSVLSFKEVELYDDQRNQVGLGDNAVTRLWDGEHITGIYAVDNLMHQTSITDEDLKILDIYGTAMGHLFTLKRAEEELRKSEERYRRLVEVSPDTVAVHANGKIVYVNPAALKLLHAHDELELIGKPVIDVVHPDFRELARQRIIAVMDHGVMQPMEEEKFLCLDGTSVDVEVVSVPTTFKGMNAVQVIVRNITERKQAEMALRDSIERYKNLTEISPVGIFHTDESGLTTYVNPKWCQISGLTYEKALGNGWLVAVHPDDKEMLFKGWEEATHVHKTSFSEYRFLRPDGTIAWVMGQAIPETNSKNQLVGYIGTITDITEIKRAEESLKHERNLFRVLIDNLPDAIYVKDSECRKTIANVADVHNMGKRFEAEVLGKTDFDLYPAEIAAGFYTDDLSVIQTGRSVINKEEFFFDKDGKKNWLLTFKLPMRDDHGKIIGLVGIGREITEQKRVMETLTLLSHTVKSIQESISITDLNNNLLFVNEAFIKTYGYTEQELIGKSIAIVSTDPEVHEQTVLAETIKGGWQGELVNRKKDGTIFPIHLSTSVVYDEKEQPIGLVGVATDITERKQAEEALRESQTLYHSFIEHLPAGVFRKDREGRYVFVNTLFCQLKGMEMEEVLGKTPHELAVFASAMKPTRPSIVMAKQSLLEDEAVNHHELILRSGKSIEVEEVHPQFDGTTKYFYVVKSPVFAPDGKMIGTQGVQFDITERRLAEEALRERDEKLSNIVENGTNLFYSRNTDQVFTYLSPQARDIFDCEPEDALVPFTEFMVDNPINRLGCDLAKKAVETGTRQETYELELMSRKGRRVWVEIQEAPVVKDGKTISIVGAATDITERRWAEMALQVSEKKYRDIVTWAPIGIYQSTQSGKLLTANKSIVEMLGYQDVSDLIGCDIGKEIYCDETERERLVLQHEKFGQSLTLNAEVRWKKKDGSIIWVLMTVHDVRDKSSEILYYEGFVFDITERKRAEEALRVNEERYRLLVENSSDIVTEISADDKFLYVSPNVKSILAFDPLELVGTGILSRVYGRDKAAIGEILSKLGGSATYRYRDKSGGWHWFESSGRVYYTSSGEQRMVMVSRDITQRRKAEQQLENSRKQLQHFTEHLEHILEEERKRISRELHDELGQLLTILKFDLSWLKLEGTKSDSDNSARIDAMMESVNEALASVKRISKEIRPPQLDALGLVGAIQWDIDQVDKKTGLKGIVTVEPTDLEIKGEISTILYRVFREALTNILRHAQAKHVFIKLFQRTGCIILIIKDDGRGITKKELKGTTSLGLVGMRERIRMIDGTFSIEGERGGGTELTVEVPMKKKKNGERKT